MRYFPDIVQILSSLRRPTWTSAPDWSGPIWQVSPAEPGNPLKPALSIWLTRLPDEGDKLFLMSEGLEFTFTHHPRLFCEVLIGESCADTLDNLKAAYYQAKGDGYGHR